MYCKKCGHEIDNNSVFCNKCGTKQVNKKLNIKNHIFTIIIILSMILTIILIGVQIYKINETNNNKDSEYNEPQWLVRNARNSDLTIASETNYSNLGIDIIIMPKTDIKNLEIKLVHYDKNGNELLTQYKTIGNVKEGVQVKTQVQLLDFSFSDMFKVYNTEIYVTEGTVSYFQ